MKTQADSLRAQLDYEPVPLKFGTSGRRGLVADLTQLEVYLNALAELEYLQGLPRSEGGIVRGEDFFFACDLRPSSSRLVPGPKSRGELAQAIAQAIEDAGMRPVFLGPLPTPALASYGFSQGKGSMMITGSHIPFDRNGYKTNTATRELLKRDEAPIQARVEQIRARLYQQPLASSPFAAQGPLAGMFKQGSRPLPPEHPAAAEAYLRRYTDFFAGRNLRGLRLAVYQHSAVGRDLLVQLLQEFGAEVIPAGRSETFVPIDTEAIDEQQLGVIQGLAAAAWREHGPIDAVVSTDGDSDRPLILGVEPVQEVQSAECRVQSEGPNSQLPLPIGRGEGRGEGANSQLSTLNSQHPEGRGEGPLVRFFGGDLVGMVVAEYLGADAVVVPISCNDAVDRGALKEVVQPKTRIGSPFVIAGMEQALAQGRKVVCGWEANGGFLLGSNITREGRTLRALPTRDAFLPILAVLLSAREKGIPVSALFDRLPRRFSRAALLKQFPRATSLRMLGRFRPADQRVEQVAFENGQISAKDADGAEVMPATATLAEISRIRGELEGFFSGGLGFGSIVGLNYTDGVRLYFSNGDVAHMRPSGNADELRIYAVADSQERANTIAQLGVSEPDGILRRIERSAQTENGN